LIEDSIDNLELSATQVSNIYLWRSSASDDFDFPTIEEIRQAQQQFNIDNIENDENGRIFIPDINGLRIRIMIAAHSGPGGHRGYITTQQSITDRFIWPNMNEEIKLFVNDCLIA